jgi:hypothetical protein
MDKELNERLIALKIASQSMCERDELVGKGMELITDLELGGECEALLGLACDQMMDTELRIEAGKAGARTLATHPERKRIMDFPETGSTTALLHVALDTGLCWSGSLPEEVRFYAAMAAVDTAEKDKDLKILVDELLCARVPVLAREKAARALEKLLLERKEKVAGVAFQSLAQFEAAIEPEMIRELATRYSEPDYRSIFEEAARTGFSDRWLEIIGLGESYREEADPRWLSAIASGDISLIDMMDIYTGEIVEIPEDRAELTEKARIYAGLSAIGQAPREEIGLFMLFGSRDHWTLGDVAEELTDADEVPPVVARAAIEKVSERIREMRSKEDDKKIRSPQPEVDGPAPRKIRR